MVVAAAQAQRIQEAEINEQDSLLLTRNLLRIAIFNISYIRGLFPENYFNDKSVPALEMKIKKLMPMDAESRRLIDWMEKGVYDALQKKYLKTLLFCICENETGPMIEEYAFSFSYSDSSEVLMNVSRSGNKKQGTTFKSSSEDFSPNQIRSCACKMVRTLIQLMRTLDRMPDERTIIMKLCYYDEVTPQDYEPPFFRCCGEQEHNSWSKAPLKLKVGGVDSKHFMIALKVKSVLDPCEDDNENIYDDVNDVSLGDLELQDNDDSETQQEGDDAAMDLEEDEVKNPSPKYNNSSAVEEEMKEVEEEDNTKDLELVKDWILSRNMATVETTDVLCQFPEIPLVIVEDIMDILVKEKLLVQLGRDKYCIRFGGKANDDKAPAKEENVMSRYTEQDESEILYDKALSYTLTMDYISVSKLQSKFSDKINQSVARKMIERMVLDGYVDRASGNRRQGRRVLHSEKAKKKLSELKDRLSGAAQQGKGRGAIDKSSIPETPVSDRDGSTNGRLHSLGSEQTRYGQSPLKESPICGQKNSRISGSEFKKPASPDDQKGRMSKPTLSRESTVKYGKVNSDAEQMDLENMKCSQETSEWRDMRSRKTSTVREPIHQHAKRLKN